MGLTGLEGFTHISRTLWKSWAEKVIFFALTFLLCGCSFSPPPNSAPATSQHESEPLRVITHGLNCPPQEFDILPNALTFATDRLSYTSAEIQQMADYINKAYSDFLRNGPEELESISPLPQTLHLVPANLTNSIDEWNISPQIQEPGCIGEMTITNISDQPVSFHGIDVRLTEVPQINQEHYRFLNVCSLPLTTPSGLSPDFPFCPAYPQGGVEDGQYEFSLHMAQAGTAFPGVQQIPYGTPTPSASQDILLPPEGSYVLHLNFRTSEKQGNLKYTIIPELNVIVSGKEETIQAKPVTTLVYADPDQISCYALQGNTFVPLQQTEVDMPPKNRYNHTWCL